MTNKKYNVVGLFDGLGGGRIALDRLGKEVCNYFASEIHEPSIAVSSHNYPDIQHIGSVVDVDTKTLPKIDLLLGGSPCQGFSFSGKMKGAVTNSGIEVTTLSQYLLLKQQGFEFDGQSYLFWEYVRVLEELRAVNPDIKFMLENVNMAHKWRKVFSDVLGVDYVVIDSRLFSGQVRKRLYWTNIDVDMDIEDRNISLYDVLETKCNKPHDYFPLSEAIFENVMPSIIKNIHKFHEDIVNSNKHRYDIPVKTNYTKNIIGLTKSATLMSGSSDVFVLDKPNKTYRKLTVLEFERLQNLPDNYTNATMPNGKPVSKTHRYKMIGNGWTIDAICHLLKNL